MFLSFHITALCEKLALFTSFNILLSISKGFDYADLFTNILALLVNWNSEQHPTAIVLFISILGSIKAETNSTSCTYSCQFDTAL